MNRLPLDLSQAGRSGAPRRADGQANGPTGQLASSDEGGEFGAIMQQLSTPATSVGTESPAEGAPVELAPALPGNPITAPAEPFLAAYPPSMSVTVPEPGRDMPRQAPRKLALGHELSGWLKAGRDGGGELSSPTRFAAAGSFPNTRAAAGQIAGATAAPHADAEAAVEPNMAGPHAREVRPPAPAEPARSSVTQAQADALPDLLSAPAAYRMLNASVVSQETHFAPVRATLAESFGPPSRPAPPGRAPASSFGSVQGLAPADPARLSRDLPASAKAVRERPFEPFAIADEVRPARASGPEEVKSSTTEAAPIVPAPASLPRATMQALVGAIAAEAAELSRSGGSQSAPAGPASPAEPNLGGPMRVLSLQLHPADLGTVTVNLRLTGRSISTTIRASNAATAQLLQQERQQLADLLHHAGYVSELPAIEGLRADMAGPTPPADTARSSHQSSPAGAETFSSEKRQDGTGAEGRSDGRDQERFLRQGRDRTDAPNSGGPRADDQYV